MVAQHERADGSILVICGETVLRWDGHDCQILAGGFTGGTSLLLGPDGQEWVFDYKTAQWMQSGMSVTLTHLGDGLGQEERHTIDFRAGIWSAVWLSGLRFFLAGMATSASSTSITPLRCRSMSASVPRIQTSAAQSGSMSTPL